MCSRLKRRNEVEDDNDDDEQSDSDFEGWAYRLFYVHKINLILFVLLLLHHGKHKVYLS